MTKKPTKQITLLHNTSCLAFGASPPPPAPKVLILTCFPTIRNNSTIGRWWAFNWKNTRGTMSVLFAYGEGHRNQER